MTQETVKMQTRKAISNEALTTKPNSTNHKIIFCATHLTSTQTRQQTIIYLNHTLTTNGHRRRRRRKNQIVFSPQALSTLDFHVPLTRTTRKKVEALVLEWIRIVPAVVEKVLDWDREVLLIFDEEKELGDAGWMEVCVYHPGELDMDWTEGIMSERRARAWAKVASKEGSRTSSAVAED